MVHLQNMITGAEQHLITISDGVLATAELLRHCEHSQSFMRYSKSVRRPQVLLHY